MPGTKVRDVPDLQPYGHRPVIADPGPMAQRNNRLLLTTGLARVEGELAMYTWASDKRRTIAGQPSGTRHASLVPGDGAPGSAGPS
jgi:hypothetical protein